MQLNGPWISPLPSLYSKAESSSFLHPLCKYCSMAANDLHTSCRTVFVGVSFFGVMVRPGGKDIVYGVGGVGKARTTRFLQCAHCTKRERREGKEEKKKEVRTPFFEGEKQIRCDRTYVVLKIQLHSVSKACCVAIRKTSFASLAKFSIFQVKHNKFINRAYCKMSSRPCVRSIEPVC